jgi:hypothetical protein
MHRPSLLPGRILVLISVRGWVEAFKTPEFQSRMSSMITVKNLPLLALFVTTTTIFTRPLLACRWRWFVFIMMFIPTLWWTVKQVIIILNNHNLKTVTVTATQSSSVVLFPQSLCMQRKGTMWQIWYLFWSSRKRCWQYGITFNWCYDIAILNTMNCNIF